MGLFCHFRHSSPFFSSLIVFLLVKGKFWVIAIFTEFSKSVGEFVRFCCSVLFSSFSPVFDLFSVFLQRFLVLHSPSLTNAISPSGREFSPAPGTRNWKPPVSSWRREILALYKLRQVGQVGSGAELAAISTAPAAKAAKPRTAALARSSATVPAPHLQRR